MKSPSVHCNDLEWSEDSFWTGLILYAPLREDYTEHSKVQKHQHLGVQVLSMV